MIGWLLTALGALVAASAVAVAVGARAVRRVDLYRWIVRNDPGSRAAGTLLSAPERIVGAANGIASLGVLVCATGLGAALASVRPEVGLVALLLIAVPAALVVVYALPHALGERWAQTLVRRVVPWLNPLAVVFAPFRRAVSVSLAGADEGVDMAQNEELTVLSGVLAFAERPVREVMTPRTEITAVREGTPLEEIAGLIADSGCSRIPVYRDSLDNIVGMVYVFDLLKIAPGAELPIRPVMVAPESKRCTDLLFEMQRRRQQFAVILDEYGGTAGIATFEDLLEELIGEIFDEYDGLPVAAGGGIDVLEAAGTTPTVEIAAQFDVALPRDAETVGGLLARAARRIPRLGERFALGGLEFDVLAATPNRVERVLVRKAPVRVIPLRSDTDEAQ